MARDRFPFAPDRVVVLAFLAGRRVPPMLEDETRYLAVKGQRLRFEASAPSMPGASVPQPTATPPTQSTPGVEVAWFAKDGSLYGRLCTSVTTAYSMLTVNFILGELGIEERVWREDDAANPQTQRWFYGTTPIEVDETFLVAGPLSMAAVRATTVVGQGA